MTFVVMDASAVLALVRDEPGAYTVTLQVGRAAISAVNLQRVCAENTLHPIIPPRLAPGERSRSRPHGGVVVSQT